MTLVWNSTDSVEFHGGRPQIQGGRQTLQFYPQDDALGKTSDPNRRTRMYVISGTFHASTWTRFNEEAFEYSLNTTYPYLIVYDHWNATSSSVATAQHKVYLEGWRANPQQNGLYYTYEITFRERD